jgi:hypothetical protein
VATVEEALRHAGEPDAAPTFGEAAITSLRRLAVCVLAGAVTGVVVGGIGGRLAMMLLAISSPSAKGVTSDDGFEIGQFTLAGTLNLLLVGVLLGVFGGAIYSVVRHLRMGPRWFEIGALAIGPGVVVGSLLVHTDGVDFRLLQPLWLTVSLFVIIPAAYGAALTVLAERWLAPGSKAASLHPALASAPVVLVAPLFPVAVPLVCGWLLLYALRQMSWAKPLMGHPAVLVIGRGALAVAFVVASVGLASDVITLM